MKNKRTYYHLIIDRSGSMNGHIEQTVEGVNQQIRRIKEIGERFPEQELITSLTLFNHRITKAWSYIKSGLLREINYSDYRPDGNTALLDAIGITLNELQKKIGAEVENNEASAVVVIVTDGYENASNNYTHSQVASLIGELEQTGKWTFSYLGVTLDAVEIAESLNIKKNNALHFNVNDISQLYVKMSYSMNSYMFDKQAGRIKTDFLETEQDTENTK
jgi:uncharacterized protein YegL